MTILGLGLYRRSWTNNDDPCSSVRVVGFGGALLAMGQGYLQDTIAFLIHRVSLMKDSIPSYLLPTRHQQWLTRSLSRLHWSRVRFIRGGVGRVLWLDPAGVASGCCLLLLNIYQVLLERLCWVIGVHGASAMAEGERCIPTALEY